MSNIQYSMKSVLVMLTLCAVIAVCSYNILRTRQAIWKPFKLSKVKEIIEKKQKIILLIEDTSEILWTGPATKDYVDTQELREFAFTKGYRLYYLDLASETLSFQSISDELNVDVAVEPPMALILRNRNSSPECASVSFAEDIIEFASNGISKLP